MNLYYIDHLHYMFSRYVLFLLVPNASTSPISESITLVLATLKPSNSAISLVFATSCFCRYCLIFSIFSSVLFACFLSLVFIACFLSLVFIACFLTNLNINDVLSGSKLSSIIGSSHPSSSHTLKILGTPLPACSPISIKLNIFIRLLFLGSDFPPLRICSFPSRIYPGFSNVSLSSSLMIVTPNFP